MADTNELLIVLTTAANEEDAADIARSVLETGLAACIQIIPRIRSLYLWKGKIADEAEVLILIKTSAAAYQALEERILSIHKYETPEIVAIAAENVSESYFKWLLSAINPS